MAPCRYVVPTVQNARTTTSRSGKDQGLGWDGQAHPSTEESAHGLATKRLAVGFRTKCSSTFEQGSRRALGKTPRRSRPPCFILSAHFLHIPRSDSRENGTSRRRLPCIAECSEFLGVLNLTFLLGHLTCLFDFECRSA